MSEWKTSFITIDTVQLKRTHIYCVKKRDLLCSIELIQSKLIQFLTAACFSGCKQEFAVEFNQEENNDV